MHIYQFEVGYVAGMLLNTHRKFDLCISLSMSSENMESIHPMEHLRRLSALLKSTPKAASLFRTQLPRE